MIFDSVCTNHYNTHMCFSISPASHTKQCRPFDHIRSLWFYTHSIRVGSPHLTVCNLMKLSRYQLSKGCSLKRLVHMQHSASRERLQSWLKASPDPVEYAPAWQSWQVPTVSDYLISSIVISSKHIIRLHNNIYMYLHQLQIIQTPCDRLWWHPALPRGYINKLEIFRPHCKIELFESKHKFICNINEWIDKSNDCIQEQSLQDKHWKQKETTCLHNPSKRAVCRRSTPNAQLTHNVFTPAPYAALAPHSTCVLISCSYRRDAYKDKRMCRGASHTQLRHDFCSKIVSIE